MKDVDQEIPNNEVFIFKWVHENNIITLEIGWSRRATGRNGQ
jgi:hypothetical protein